MQGINTIFFERGVNFAYSSDRATQLRYINSIVDALKLACPGWFDNIELVITTDSSDHPNYFIKFIIDNISLLEITMFTGSYIWGQFRIRTYYNNGNNYFTPYYSRGDSYADGQTAYISSIIYSKNFCAIETSTRTGDKKSTTIVICKSNINNTVVILPSVVINDRDNTDLLTAYHYTNNYYTERTGYRISACTVYSSFRLPDEDSIYGNCNNKIWNNYFKGSSYYSNEKTEALQSRTFVNSRFIFSPMYITGRTDEYCPDIYYVQNSPVVLSPACNAVLEIGKDYYFTNGIIAIKLT